jgi:hypothetical protein
MGKFTEFVIGVGLWMLWGVASTVAGLTVSTREFWMMWFTTLALTLWYGNKHYFTKN